MKMSEPRKQIRYSKQIANAVIERIAAGESLRSICRDPEMPNISTVLDWADKDKDGFRSRYSTAMDFRAQVMFEEMLEIADESPKKCYGEPGTGEASARAMAEKLRVDARKWMLARMAPKRYGEKITQEISGPDGGPVKTEGEYRVTPEDEKVIRRIAEARARVQKQSLNQ